MEIDIENEHDERILLHLQQQAKMGHLIIHHNGEEFRVNYPILNKILGLEILCKGKPIRPDNSINTAAKKKLAFLFQYTYETLAYN